jgi:hypothetical protein
MALSDDDYAQLEAAVAPGADVSPAFAEKARALLAKRKAAPGGASVTPAPENSLGVTGVVNQPEAELSPEDSEVGRIAAALDPRFDLIPQGLALLPATNDPRGDQAAFAGYKAGTTGEVKYAYEPPVAVVRKQLLENPNMLRLLRSDPPSPEDIAAMDSDSPLYKDAANYMWSRTAEDATKGGHTVYRYSQMPWGKEEDWSLETLGNKVGGLVKPIIDMDRAFVMGFDDTGTLGAARAATEVAGLEQKMPLPGNADVMGVNEAAPQKVSELNDWAIEDNPVTYGAGQALGAVVGAPAAVYRGILAGGSKLAQLVAKTRFGALAAKPAVKAATGLAGEVAAGTGEAMATQAGQEEVDDTARMLQGQPRREQILRGGERILDTGQDAALLGLLGAGLGRGAGAVANKIRQADRFGGGAVGRTESNHDWGPMSVLKGPGLKGETKAIVKRAQIENNAPGDYIAEKITPAIQQAGQARTPPVEVSFRDVARHGNKPKAGDKQVADALRGLADDAGVRPDLDQLRSLQETLGIQRLSRGRSMAGKSRSVFDPNNWADVGMLHSFPILRALEPGGAVTGGHLSRAALLGQVEDEAARAADQEKKKPAYEKRRAALQKEKEREREKAKKERERRRTEKHRDE